jgi:hypothetical protein
VSSRSGALGLALVLAVGAAAYAFGAYSHALDLWPISELRAFKRIVAREPQAVARLDPFGRLLAFPGKVEAPCPAQTERTAVLAIFGGSSGGNYTGQRVASQSGGRVLNYLGGKCYFAASPLLGADNTMGEYWTLLGDKLIAAGLFDTVVISVTTVGDSLTADWAPGGRLAPVLRDAFVDLARRYRATQIVLDVGEDDYLRRIDPQAFTTNYRAIVASIRTENAATPIYLTLATKCLPDDHPWSADNAIAQAERKMPETIAGLRLGVDRDALVNTLDRRDDCHLGWTGAAKMAQSWFERFSAEAAPR